MTAGRACGAGAAVAAVAAAAAAATGSLAGPPGAAAAAAASGSGPAGPGLALPAAAGLAGRRHRLVVPPPALARSLTVDESEFRIRTSKTAVGAGVVTIRVYNRGEDDHDLVVIAGGSPVAHVALKSGASAVLAPVLPPGRVRLICSLQAGTPQSHELLGMHAALLVQ
jgi:hypothetical protein